MREIKFRAWDKEEKFMLQDIQSMYDGSCNHKETEERYGWASCFYSFLDNDNYVVMQFTGLTDKNGTEIYEGDIVKFLDWKPKEVVWGNKIDKALSGCCGYMLDGTMHFLGENETYLIIGNIHDNPELVEEELE